MTQVVLRKVGDKHVSSVNSLAIDSADSARVFIRAGLVPKPLQEIPKVDEEYIFEHYPQFADGVRNGKLEIVPTRATRWNAGKNGYFDELDFTIEEKEEPINYQTVFATPQTKIQTQTQPTQRLQNIPSTRQRSNFEDLFGVLSLGMKEPLYVFYENKPGSIRQIVVPILATILENTAVAALISRGKGTRRYLESIRELCEVSGMTIQVAESRVQLKADNLKGKILGKTKPEYWTEDVYSTSNKRLQYAGVSR